MARPRKAGVPRHLHFSPYLRVKGVKGGDGWWLTYEENARVDRALAWLKIQPKGTVQEAVWQLVVAAVNGELGRLPSTDLTDGDAAQNQRALDDLLRNMVLEDDE